ncbi:WD40-repeat-containing domain protein [Radiomyces spectabilis]|uniref:WD40-repeat-containing domain protein n=1 Tax=Radiomyces spectabilis TaxID=64574 RepID=UPI0022203165|nr:WD40-repeat-containing domain protein [Radiomyces spectabilis]KAI8391796.1 WD40-repeat-containing domain protein [Radiomyces spectabilis]
MEDVELTPSIISSVHVTKRFKDNQKPITSLCFDDSGEFCVTSGEDESLNVYDCREAKLRSTLYSKKYGVNLARFTHSKSTVVYASTKEDDTLRYLSLHDNKYIRYFRGHKNKVVALEMSPLDDQLMSAALDDSIRLWDLRSSTCQGMIQIKGRPTIAFDPSGLVFAVGIGSDTIKMYDLRAYETGPFATWVLRDPYTQQGMNEWTKFKFTRDGKQIMISTAGNCHYMVDSFEGNLQQRLVGHSPTLPGNVGEAVGLSPDAKYAFSGGSDGTMAIWDIQNPNMENKPLTKLQTPHQQGISVFGFNPSLLMMVTGNEDLAFWEPKL